MKSLFVVVSMLAASAAFANETSYASYDSNEGTTDYISWCDKNNVMMVQKDQIIVLRNCSDSAQTCKVVSLPSGFRLIVTATCQ